MAMTRIRLCVGSTPSLQATNRPNTPASVPQSTSRSLVPLAASVFNWASYFYTAPAQLRCAHFGSCRSKNQPPSSLLQPRLIVVFDACIATTILRVFIDLEISFLLINALLRRKIHVHSPITINRHDCWLSLPLHHPSNTVNALQLTREIRREYCGV